MRISDWSSDVCSSDLTAGARSFDLADYGAVPAVEAFCHAIGYRQITRRDGSAFAVRADVLERLAREAYKLAAAKPAPADEARMESASAAPGFAAGAALCALAGCDPADLEALLFALGYPRHGTETGQALFQPRGARRKSPGEQGPKTGK